jgi:hypothetical protein
MADGEGRRVPGIVLEQDRDALVVHDVAMLDAMSALAGLHSLLHPGWWHVP